MTTSKRPTIKLSTKLRSKYSTVTFGSLLVSEVQNRRKFGGLEKNKRRLEQTIRQSSIKSHKDDIIDSYNEYFIRWGKTYPIEYQINTIKKGGNFPQISVLVDIMFLAELSNRILTSGHDADLFQGNLFFDVSEG